MAPARTTGRPRNNDLSGFTKMRPRRASVQYSIFNIKYSMMRTAISRCAPARGTDPALVSQPAGLAWELAPAPALVRALGLATAWGPAQSPAMARNSAPAQTSPPAPVHCRMGLSGLATTWPTAIPCTASRRLGHHWTMPGWQRTQGCWRAPLPRRLQPARTGQCLGPEQPQPLPPA
jgi:hypothetical protein